MRKLIYAFGIATFLAMLIFTIVTSLTNPFYGMSEAALAQGSGATTTGGDKKCQGRLYCVPNYTGGLDAVTGLWTCCHKKDDFTGCVKT